MQFLNSHKMLQAVRLKKVISAEALTKTASSDFLAKRETPRKVTHNNLRGVLALHVYASSGT